MALAGVGVDIVDIARMERAMERTPAFCRRVFTEEERAYCEGRARPAEHYAARFAAREAVLKALGTGFSGGVGMRDVSVAHDAAGRPVAVLTGKVKEIAEEQGVLSIALSLSFTHDVAVANAVAITDAVRPHPDESPDPKRELELEFRDARALIDELDRMDAAMLDNAEVEDNEDDDAREGAAGTADEPAAGADARDASQASEDEGAAGE